MPRISEHKRTAIKRAFIAALRDEFTVGVACDLVHVGRTAIYAWRKDDPEFAAAWDDAQEHALDALAGSLYRRAMDDDTTAAIFMLKSHRRETYGDKVDVNLTLRQEAKRLADEMGLSVDDVLAEAGAILAGSK